MVVCCKICSDGISFGLHMNFLLVQPFKGFLVGLKVQSKKFWILEGYCRIFREGNSNLNSFSCCKVTNGEEWKYIVCCIAVDLAIRNDLNIGIIFILKF